LGINVYAQTCEIFVTADRPFKIKLEKTVSSATARESDYVQFTTLEPIYSTRAVKLGKNTSTAEDKCPFVLFDKGTSIFGVVTRRKHRRFPFRNGELEVQLDPLKNWDGNIIQVAIKRHEPPPRKDPPKTCKEGDSRCLAGRKNAPVAPVVPGIATAGSSVVAGVADDKTTRIIAVSGIFTLVGQGGIAELLNGTDAALEAGEVFDLIIAPGLTVIPTPKEPEKPKTDQR